MNLLRRITRFVSSVRHEIAFYRHMNITMGRHVFGRWYFFRDRPLWFVTTIAAWEIVPDDDKYAPLNEYIMEAQREMSRRLLQFTRAVDAIVASIEQDTAAGR